MGRRIEKWEREAASTAIGTCEDCGKQSFTSKKAAIRAGRRAHGREGHLNAYPCPRRDGFFHYGRLPKMVTNGDATRADLIPRQRLA